VEKASIETVPSFDPQCYLCPGNERAGGARNPKYEKTLVFENDFAALFPTTPAGACEDSGLLIAKNEPGLCRVVCFSPRHDLTLALMSLSEIREVVDVWIREWEETGRQPHINYVLVFENRGAAMGASNPHPHCQIWSTASIPNEPAKEQAAFTDHLQQRGECLLCAYLREEFSRKERVIFENESFAVIVPFWAIWPFETIVISKRHFGGMDELSSVECDGLAETLKVSSGRYDKLFSMSSPYSMGFHQCPTDGRPHAEWHFHAHYYPPLLHSTMRKFMVGYEMLGSPQRDITPEIAASRLREVHL
jgi:UDPglucose--hexose-1-phosphate uridylyltransferase